MIHQTSRRRWLHTVTSGTTTAGLLLLAAPAMHHHPPATPARVGQPALPEPRPDAEAPVSTALRLVGHHKPHPHRSIKKYRVRPGDTPSSIAVRYHAWTAQLMRINHTRTLYAGEVILVPVVTKAQRACTKHKNHFTNYGRWRNPHPGKHHAKPKHHHAKPKPHHAKPKPHRTKPKPHRSGWRNADASRAQVRRVVVAKANRHGVNPHLALAIAWQESGWQQRRVSSAGALGVMQVLPGTGRWMATYAGKTLHLRGLHDNVTAGVLLIRWLRSEAGLKNAVAGYYQGLAGVERYGMYPSTKRYVANVLALKKRIANGWSPA